MFMTTTYPQNEYYCPVCMLIIKFDKLDPELEVKDAIKHIL